MNPFGQKPAAPGAKRKRKPKTHITVDHPQHGKIEIRHMKRGLVHGEPCVLMAAAMAGAVADQPVWIQIAKAGSFNGHSAGPFEMNAKTFAEIIHNFKAHPEHIPVDFEHASESPASEGSIPHTGAPAQGWIVDMKVEQDGNLYGLVEWGTLARDYIKNGQYKYFSPAIRFGAKDRVSGKPIGARMTSGALTNSPFLSGMQKVAAKDIDDGDEEIADDLDELEDDTNDLPASAGHQPADMEAHVEIEKKLKDTEDRLAVMTDKATLADTKATEASKLITAKDGELALVRTENASLMAWKTEREESDNKSEVEVAFQTWKDKKCLTDDIKPAMLATLKAAPDAFRAQYPVVALAQRHLLRNVSAPREASSTVEAPPALRTPDDFIALSDKIRRDTKCTREESLIEADKQFRAARRSA
jgi:phage I-like protein